MPSARQRSKKTWSPWAQEYARTPERYVFGTGPSDFALEVARLVPPGDYVLDLGCGEGRDSVFFAERGAVVWGVDLSAAGLEKAQRLARKRGVRVRFIQAAVDEEVLPAGPFHLVYSCGSLHYVSRRRRAALFARLRAVTRPGGHHAHLVFTDRLTYEEKGEIVEYYHAGELHEAFVDWQVLKRADHVISCAQDGSVHGHAVEEIVAARPVGPAPWPSEP